MKVKLDFANVDVATLMNFFNIEKQDLSPNCLNKRLNNTNIEFTARYLNKHF